MQKEGRHRVFCHEFHELFFYFLIFPFNLPLKVEYPLISR
jgi:hypothetical protein